MTLQAAIGLALQFSIFLMVLGICLKATPADALYLWRRPGELIRSIIAMNVVMPVVALCMALYLPLDPPVKMALVALSVCPIPPFLPRTVGPNPYAISLVAFTGVLALVVAPGVLALMAALVGDQIRVYPRDLFAAVVITMVAPLVLGVAIHTYLPKVAARIVKPVSVAAIVIIVLAFAPILFAQRRAMFDLIGDGTLVAIIGFVLVGLAAGHFLGGPDPEDRRVLAVATASRHPAIAMAVVNLAFPEAGTAAAAVLLAFLIGAVLSPLYLRWRVRRDKRGPAPASPRAGHA